MGLGLGCEGHEDRGPASEGGAETSKVIRVRLSSASNAWSIGGMMKTATYGNGRNGKPNSQCEPPLGTLEAGSRLIL